MGVDSVDKRVELEITDLAYDGKSVAHLDGKVVFLRGGLPGETVEAEIIRSRPRYCEAVVCRILKPSDQRIPAICPHFDQCGGCTWQDLIYQQQLERHLPQANISAYESAADCLRKMRPIMKSLKREKQWHALVAEIRQKYRNRPRFMEILERLKGRTILETQKARRKRR